MDNKNYASISNAEQLAKYMELSKQNVVILLIYSQHNPDVNIFRESFITVAGHNRHSIFLMINVDVFQGNSPYVLKTPGSVLPRCEYHYQGNVLASKMFSSQTDLHNSVAEAQRFMMSNQNKTSLAAINAEVDSNKIANDIFDSAKNFSPALESYLKTNPDFVNQLVKHIKQNASVFQQILNSPSSLAAYAEKEMNAQKNRQLHARQQLQQQVVPPIVPIGTTEQYPAPVQQLITSLTKNSLNGSIIPLETDINNAMDQIKKMLVLFEALHRMGLLKTNITEPSIKIEEADPPGTTIGPNGDKFIPLPDGRYKRIKKKN
jgi:hypothetical protein